MIHSNVPNVRAIIFDCFGVLASDGLLPFRKKYFGQDPELLQESIDYGRRVDAGLASYGDFIIEQARMAQVSVQEARKQIECNVPDEALFAYINGSLKQRFQLGFLSNAGDDWLTEIFTSEQVQLFDAIVLSYQTGLIKPDVRAYESVADKLGIEPRRCVMVDDQPRYVEGARQAGMQAICYQSFPQFKTDLELLLSREGV